MKDKYKPEVWAEIADPATICDRLRGVYRIPIRDGLGPIDGKMTFDRHHQTPPIQHAAAELIEDLRFKLGQAEIVLLDALAHLAAATSAYERYGRRSSRFKVKALVDALFSTRLKDFKAATHRANRAHNRMVEEREQARGPYSDLSARKSFRGASEKIGSWLSAAMQDENVCAEMKADIEAWFAALEEWQTGPAVPTKATPEAA